MTFEKIAHFATFALLAFGFVPRVIAQTVVQAASVRLQPQIERDDIDYSSCGLHALILDVQGKSVDVYDFSVNIRAGQQFGLIKAGKMEDTLSNMLAGKSPSAAVLPAPTNFWIAKEAEGTALRLLKIIPGDTPGYILGGADLVKTYQILLAMANGERIQLATRYGNQRLDTVVSFGKALPDIEFEPLMACMSGVTRRTQNEAKAKD